MKFNLTKPCAKCPFRSDIDGYLTKGRVSQLERDLERGVFACHATLDYDNPVDEDGQEPSETEKTAHCAGALILLEKEGRPSQMMRIAERFNSDGKGYDPEKLDMDAPVYDSFRDMRKAMPR